MGNEKFTSGKTEEDEREREKILKEINECRRPNARGNHLRNLFKKKKILFKTF